MEIGGPGRKKEEKLEESKVFVVEIWRLGVNGK